MALDKDLQQLFGDVRVFLHTVLPTTIQPPPVEAERLRLLKRMQCIASSRPELQLLWPGDTLSSAGNDIEEEDEGLLQEKDAGITEEIVSSEGRSGPPGMAHTQGSRVKRSSSLSSRSSSGSTSYTSNSYTSTSNGYSSFEGGGGVASKPVQEDIYEEFDAVHMRIAAITPVSSPTSTTTDTSSTPTSVGTTTTTPFFSSWRNSLTYGKKEKRDSLHSESGKDGVIKDKSKDNKKQATAKNNKKNDKANKKEKKFKNKRESSSAVNSENKENLNEEETSEYDVTDGSQDITVGSSGDGLKDPDSIDGGEADLGEDVSINETSVGHDIEEHDDEEEVENSYMEGLQPVAFCSAVARCARHGVIHKKSKALLRSWRPFQAVVAPGVLLLYAKESDQRQRKGLELGLYDVRVATAEAEQQHDRRDLVYFELVAPARKTHTFMTRTMSDRDEWIQAVGQYTRNRNSLPVLGAAATPSVGSSAASSTPLMPASLRGSVATRLNAHLVPSPLTFAERAEGGAGDDEVLSTTGSQEDEDTFSSDEVYEEVNMDDIRSDSGPSLSEMLQPHLFPNNLSTYYMVPDEDDPSSVTMLSTSTPKKPQQEGVPSPPTLAKRGKQPPARPPPPAFSIEKLTKNQSALHQKMVISPKTTLLNAFKTSSKFSLPSSIAAVKDRSPIACKKLGFSGSSSRPLPPTPYKPAVDDGEIYCEIDEEDDYYEESETDGVNLMTGTSQDSGGKKLYSVKDLPPPLPSRGPPPIPNLEQLICRNKSATAFDPDLFEDYDIPGDVDMQLLTHNLTNTDQESETFAPLPQDLSLVLPTYPRSPNTTPIKNPPIPEKGSFSKNDDNYEENVYKVPSSAPVNDDIYQVPPPNPIPVNNNNTISGLEKTSSTPGSVGAPELSNSSPPLKPRQSGIDQSPTDKRQKVIAGNSAGLKDNNNQSNNTLTSILSNGLVNRSSPIKRDNSRVIEQSQNTLNSPSDTDDTPYKKTSFSKTISPAPSLGSLSKSGSVSGSNSLSVKARIALLNQNEVEVPSQGSPSKCSDDFVVMVDNKEIRLDQAKKRAFLESTLNMSEPGQCKLGPKACIKRGDI